MSRPLPILVVQAAPLRAAGAGAEFADQSRSLIADFPNTRLLLFPELHLCGVEGLPAERTEQLHAIAEPIAGPRTRMLGELAAELGVWLVPGTVCERGQDGGLYNTALAFSPAGELVAAYRKCFPWRPYEPYRPGDRFVVFDIEGVGRAGLSVCYDAWFPEVARHLAWMGAEMILNPTQTTTSDRAQEVVLAHANAIVNQVFVVSANAASPVGTGASLVVDPEGRVRVEAGQVGTVLTDVLDFDDVTRVRRFGTAGLNRMWSQFTPHDQPLELPLYQGRMEPGHWTPAPTGAISAEDQPHVSMPPAPSRSSRDTSAGRGF